MTTKGIIENDATSTATCCIEILGSGRIDPPVEREKVITLLSVYFQRQQAT